MEYPCDGGFNKKNVFCPLSIVLLRATLCRNVPAGTVCERVCVSKSTICNCILYDVL